MTCKSLRYRLLHARNYHLDLNNTFQRFKTAILVARILRVVRVMRVFKLSQYSESLRMFGRVFHAAAPRLCVYFVVAGVIVLFFSTVIYQIEQEFDADTEFVSIPAAAWWCFVAVTSVGYGDMYPKSLVGRISAVFTFVVGIIVVALPVSILVEHYWEITTTAPVEKTTQPRKRRVR